MSILRDLMLWFWHLLPGNPILVRVVSTGGKRTRHLWARVFYLGALFLILVIVGSNTLGGSASLAELAKRSSQTFFWVSLMQLFMTAFVAPVFAAGAITQEKDANTFHILLTTPMSDAQIVFGSLFSRLLFVWVLLLAGVPIFGITMIYGGVTLTEVLLSIGLAACTALVAGAVAIMLSITRVGTRRTIFSFFVGIAVYLIGLWAVGVSSWGQLAEAPPGEFVFGSGGQPVRMSWLAPLHPFMSLLAVTGQTPAPSPEAVAHLGWPRSWMLAHPYAAYMVITTLASVLMVLYSLFFVRRGGREGETTWWTGLTSRFRAAAGADQRVRRPRHVWNNPIAWREAATRASAGGRSTLRWMMIVAGVAFGFVLVLAIENGWWGFTPASGREAITYLLWIELLVVLLFVTSTAATSLTREKESQSMELLLTTPLTSRDLVWGTLRGLISFVLPLLLMPASTLLLLLGASILRADWVMVLAWCAALLCVPALMLAYAANAAIWGLHMSLQSRKTVQAVMVSTGGVVLAVALLSGCAAGIGASAAMVGGFMAPFAPLPAMTALVSPESLFSVSTPPTPDVIAGLRSVNFAASLIAIAVYAGIAYAFHAALVRNFDMTIRRQSA